MDKQVIINELTWLFINDSSLDKLLKNSNQANLLAMYQALFNLWNRTVCLSKASVDFNLFTSDFCWYAIKYSVISSILHIMIFKKKLIILK